MKNPGRPIRAVVLYSLKSKPEIKKPLKTKNKSTPAQPVSFQKPSITPCLPSTSPTAIQRRISSRLFLMVNTGVPRAKRYRGAANNVGYRRRAIGPPARKKERFFWLNGFPGVENKTLESEWHADRRDDQLVLR